MRRTVVRVPPDLAGAAAVAALVATERRSPHPLVDTTVLRSVGLLPALVCALLLAGVTSTQGYFVTLDLQRVLGQSAAQTGLVFLPSTVLVLLGARLSARLSDRHGPKVPLVAGLAVMALSMFWLSGVGADGTVVGDVLGGLTLSGLGLGMASVAQTTVALARVRDGDEGVASGLLSTAQQIGLAVGLAVVAAVAAGVTAAADGPQVVRDVEGYRVGFTVIGGVALVAVAVAVTRVRGASGRST